MNSCKDCPVHKKNKTELTHSDYVIALAGNPNTGKSTLFNLLTGLRQHTGNWPGKTVEKKEGAFTYKNTKFKLVDLPGTYSLLSMSDDEEIARNFILFENPDLTLITIDAVRPERNLNLALQVLEMTDNVIICLNMMDEAQRKGIQINHKKLSRLLGVPVIPISARHKQGIDNLLETIYDVATGKLTPKPRRIESFSPELDNAIEILQEKLRNYIPDFPNLHWLALRLLEGDNEILARTLQNPEVRKEISELAEKLRWKIGNDIHDLVVEAIYARSHQLVSQTVKKDSRREDFEIKLDKILTSKTFGIPIMILLLGIVLWITISGANYISEILAEILVDKGYVFLKKLVSSYVPPTFTSFLIDGVYLATAWVVSVMLPPMAIFFPLFTLLEDFGYLPRIAFNLDNLYKKVGAHGKQALTMTMGFGCNAAAIVSTRIIDSPRERLLAILTNNFSLCNGRWPLQILLATLFIAPMVPEYLSVPVATLAVLFVALLGIAFTFLASLFFSRTLLRGEVSVFTLELPPYRPPQFLKILYTSFIERTLIVLWRAVVFAAPAGAVIWLVSNLKIADTPLAEHIVNFLNPFGILVGLNGVILLAYIIAIPANEIVIPTILMLTVLLTGTTLEGVEQGRLFETEGHLVKEILLAGGWTFITAINVMLFSLLHNPCSTTIYTIYKETRSWKWTFVATFFPVLLGFTVTFLVKTFFG